MSDVMSHDLALANARTFVAQQFIPALHRLATLARLDTEGRTAIHEIADALSTLPNLNPDANIRLEVDLYWEDRNWIGTLDLADSALKLRSNLCQLEGLKSELNGQWQHTALDVNSKVGTVLHDPSHLWFWIDCFRRSVDGFFSTSTAQRATLKLVSHSSNLDLYYGMTGAEKGAQ